MADASQVEQQVSRVEQPPAPEGRERVEDLLEDPAKTGKLIEKIGGDAVVEVHDYTGVADGEPGLSESVRAQAAALEAEILKKQGIAIDAVEMVRSGKPASIAETPALVLENDHAEQSSSDGLGVEKTNTEIPQAKPAEKSSEAAPIDLFTSRLTEIIAEYTASNSAASKLMLRKIAKLEADADPAKFQADPQLVAMASEMKRLEEAMLDGKPFEASAQEAAAEASVAPTEVSAKESPEETAEQLDPQAVAEEAATFALSALEHGGEATMDMLMDWPALSAKLDRAAGQSAAARTLKELFDAHLSNPVALLESLSVFASEHPDVAAASGVMQEKVTQALEAKAEQDAKSPEHLANDVGSVAYELLAAGGESTSIATAFAKLADTIRLAETKAAPGDQTWRELSTAISQLKSAMDPRISATPADRLKVLKVFAEDAPELAAEHGVTREAIDVKLAELAAASHRVSGAESAAEADVARGGAEGAEAGAVLAAESAVAHADGTADLEAQQLRAKKLNDDLESALAAGDETRLQSVVDDIEKSVQGQIAMRQEELDELYAAPAKERTDLMQARIDELEYANAIDRKALMRRKAQLELMKLQKEKKQLDAEVEAAQKEAEAASPDAKAGVEQKLADLQTKQKELGERIGTKEQEIADLADAILQLTRLMERAQLEGERAEEHEEAAAEDDDEVEASGGASASASFGGGSGFESAGGGATSKKAGVSGEDVIHGAVSAMHDLPGAALGVVEKVFGPSSKKD
jgi:hypothetical protein